MNNDFDDAILCGMEYQHIWVYGMEYQHIWVGTDGTIQVM